MQHVEIVIKGHLDPHWSEWLAGMTITHTVEDSTVLCGTVSDSSALYGLLSRLRDLGLTLISVVTIEPNDELDQLREEAK